MTVKVPARTGHQDPFRKTATFPRLPVGANLMSGDEERALFGRLSALPFRNSPSMTFRGSAKSKARRVGELDWFALNCLKLYQVCCLSHVFL